MQKSRQQSQITALGLCLILGLTQVILPASALARGVRRSSTAATTNSSVGAPIGTITSSGVILINGRATSGQQNVWNGELIQAPANASASVTLAALGQLTLASGAQVRVGRTENTRQPTLVASVYAGTAELTVAPAANAYLESAGQAWIVAGDSRLKLSVNAGEPTLRVVRGRVSQLGGWSLKLPSLTPAHRLSSGTLNEAALPTAERAALLHSVQMATAGNKSTQAVRLLANARAAMLGMVESSGTLMLNGRATRRQELLWDGELIQAPDNAEARASLANLGSVKLAPGARARLSTAAAADRTKSQSRVLAANLLNGEMLVRLDEHAIAYVETQGKAFVADPGAHFRLSEQLGQVTLEIKAGRVREINSWKMEWPAALIREGAIHTPSEGRYNVRLTDNADSPGYLRKVKPAETQELRFFVTDRAGKVAAGLPIVFTLNEADGQRVGTLGTGMKAGLSFATRTDDKGIAVVPFNAGRAAGSASITAAVAGIGEGNSSVVVVDEDKNFWSKRNALPVFAVIGGVVAAGIIVGLTREEKLPIQGRGGAQIVP